MWQDYVLAVGAFMFTIALIPTLRGKNKPAFSTSAMTASVLVIFTVTYATLELWLATVAQAIGACAWTVLAWQAHKRAK